MKDTSPHENLGIGGSENLGIGGSSGFQPGLSRSIGRRKCFLVFHVLSAEGMGRMPMIHFAGAGHKKAGSESRLFVLKIP